MNLVGVLRYLVGVLGEPLFVVAVQKIFVVVFGATSPQGVSVIKGLLNDTRKRYTVIAATNDERMETASILKELDPDRVQVVYADLDDVQSCQKAAEGVGGAFLVTDFYGSANQTLEEQHAKNPPCHRSHLGKDRRVGLEQQPKGAHLRLELLISGVLLT